MTREEFNALTPSEKREHLLSLMNEEMLDFAGYYKYHFTYKGGKVTPLGAVELTVVYGDGDSSDIYRSRFGPCERFYCESECHCVSEITLDGVSY